MIILLFNWNYTISKDTSGDAFPLFVSQSNYTSLLPFHILPLGLTLIFLHLIHTLAEAILGGIKVDNFLLITNDMMACNGVVLCKSKVFHSVSSR